MEWVQYNTGLNSKWAIMFNLSKLWGSLHSLTHSYLKTIEPMEVHRGSRTMCNTETSKVISRTDPVIPWPIWKEIEWVRGRFWSEPLSCVQLFGFTSVWSVFKVENMKRKSNGFRFFLIFRPIFAAKKLAYFGIFLYLCSCKNDYDCDHRRRLGKAWANSPFHLPCTMVVEI